MRSLAERLKEAREDKQWSQADLARRAGVAVGTIGNLEAGIRRTARKLTTIASTLGVRPEWLADEKGPKHADRRDGVAAWPFETISPAEWDSLTERQRGAVEEAARQVLDRFLAIPRKRRVNERQ